MNCGCAETMDGVVPTNRMTASTRPIAMVTGRRDTAELVDDDIAMAIDLRHNRTNPANTRQMYKLRSYRPEWHEGTVRRVHEMDLHQDSQEFIY